MNNKPRAKDITIPSQSILLWRMRTVLVAIIAFFLIGGMAVFSIPIAVISGFFCTAGMIYIIIYHIPKYYKVYFLHIEGQRICLKKGIFVQKSIDVPMFRIQYVELVASPFQRILGLANLIIHTAGSKVVIEQMKKNDAEILKNSIEDNI